MRAALAAVAAAVILLAPTPAAAADPGNNQSPSVLCKDADYADLHPTICNGGFSLGAGGGAQQGKGGSGGLLGGLVHSLTGGLL